MLLSFWIRRPESGGEPGPAVLYVQAERSQPRFEFAFSGYRQWQQHVRTFAAPADCNPRQGNISIHLGKAGPAVDVADLQLIDYGSDIDITELPQSVVTYKGRDPDATWRKEALARIETIRKGKLTITVVDAGGQPVKDVKVSADMRRHAFDFGTAVNSKLLGAAESEFPFRQERGGVTSSLSWQDAQTYRDTVATYFNCVTFESELRPHVWKQQMSDDPAWAHRRRLFLEQAVPWLQANHMGIRGHYIAWGAMDYNPLEKEFIGKNESPTNASFAS